MDKRQQKLMEQAVNHPLRREIIRNGFQDSETVAQRLGIDRQVAKQHLTILKRVGVIKSRHKDHVSERVNRFRVNDYIKNEKE